MALEIISPEEALLWAVGSALRSVDRVLQLTDDPGLVEARGVLVRLYLDLLAARQGPYDQDS
jgi:hypothetical protein